MPADLPSRLDPDPVSPLNPASPSPGSISFSSRFPRLRRLPLGALGVALAVSLAGACGGEEEGSVLQPSDLEAYEGAADEPFDRNKVLESADFQDTDEIDAEKLQIFLGKTTYDRPSFLETYQSNGVRAADALARAGRQYRINPLVLLAYAQAVEGLVGERNYPEPPTRIEYVFRCGCFKADNCDPNLAGFDRQLDCLGRSLRVALNEMADNGRTTSGWGVDTPGETVDGMKVTPTNDATAAIYDHIPIVAEDAGGGSWVLWNIFHKFAVKMGYSGSAGGAASGRWIGEPCVSDSACAPEGSVCAENYPDGHCTVKCEGDCPTSSDRPASFCASFTDDGGYCLTICNPGAPACRRGYKCVRIARYRAPQEASHVCYPETANP